MSYIVAVDFDGTIAEHEYPGIGKPVPGAFLWLQKFQEAGAKLILWTLRSEGGDHGDTLTPAVEFCRAYGVEFWGVNKNPDQNWSTSPKAYANVFIDDAAFGCPIRPGSKPDSRPMVDWREVGKWVCGDINIAETRKARK